MRGSAALAVACVALAYGSWQLRRRLVPAWDGSAARLAELILGLSLLVVALELVGVVGAFRPTIVMIAVPVVGVAMGVVARKGISPGESPALEAEGPRWELLASLALVGVVFVQWSLHAAAIAGAGM